MTDTAKASTDAQLVDAIRFHEAALNSLFEQAAQRRLKVELQGEMPSYYGRFRVPGDEWQEQEPPVDACRFHVVVHRPL